MIFLKSGTISTSSSLKRPTPEQVILLYPLENHRDGNIIKTENYLEIQKQEPPAVLELIQKEKAAVWSDRIVRIIGMLE